MSGIHTTFDASLIDALDWKLGTGRGRPLLLAMTLRYPYFRPSWIIMDTFGDAVTTVHHGPRHGQIGLLLTLAEGVVWDGETLTVPGTWPETMTGGLAGRRVMEVVDHPAIPRDRLIESVVVEDDRIILVSRRGKIGREQLQSPTWPGHMRDRMALKVAESRFNRTQRIHTGFSLIALFSGVLGAIFGFIGGLLATLTIVLPLHFMGVPDPFLDPVFWLIPAGGLVGMALLYAEQHYDLQVDGVGVIIDRMAKRFGRGFV